MICVPVHNQSHATADKQRKQHGGGGAEEGGRDSGGIRAQRCR